MGGKAPLLTRMVARFLYGCQLCCQYKNKIELFSSDGVSILGLGLEKRLMTHLCESRSQLEIWGLVSVTSLLFSDFEIARTWLSKTSLIQRVFSRLYLQVRHNENRLKKCQIFEKMQLGELWRHFFSISAKSTNFEVSSLCLGFQVSSLGIFYEVSASKVTVSTTSLLFSVANAKQIHHWNWSATYFILRIRISKISLFRMVLKRLKLHQITSIFRWCGTKSFLHTSMQNFIICSITPMR